MLLMSLRAILVTLAAIILVLCLGFFTYLALQKPSDSRAWLPEYENTATVKLSETHMSIHNLRDWTYGDDVLVKDWTDLTVDPRTVTRVWFIVEPFGSFEGIAHTFLSFEFEDGTTLAFSVQARQEVGEAYSATQGLLNSYELAYQWGTERDFIARRAVYLSHDLRLYPLQLSPDDAERLLRTLAEETNELAEHPRFYNTLTANCTNILAKIVNEHYPGKLPYDLSWNLTGYSDLYLMDAGLIASPGTKEEARTAASLAPYRLELMEAATSSPQAFSARIRSLLGYNSSLSE